MGGHLPLWYLTRHIRFMGITYRCVSFPLINTDGSLTVLGPSLTGFMIGYNSNASGHYIYYFTLWRQNPYPRLKKLS